MAQIPERPGPGQDLDAAGVQDVRPRSRRRPGATVDDADRDAMRGQPAGQRQPGRAGTHDEDLLSAHNDHLNL